MSIDTTKIIHGVVGGGRYTVTSPIVKEDYGLYLKIEGLELPPTYEVDFSNSEHNGTSVTMIGNADGVLIPSQFISSGKDVFAFLYHVGVDFGRTVYKFRIPNKCRPDRTNEQPTPEEQSVIDQAIAALNDAVEQTAQDVASAHEYAQASASNAESASASAQSADASREAADESEYNAQVYAENAQASATASAQSASQSAQIKDDVEDMVDDAQASASASAQSASASANSASQASGYATSASQSATSAQGYASQAQTSANTASTKASEASTSASTASAKATESAQSASQALTYKTDAESAKTASQTAQGLAESARDDAIDAKTDAGSARDEAQTIVDGISAKAEQIDQNTADIASIEDDVSDIESEIFEKTEDESVYNINFLRRIDTNGAYITASSGKYCVTDRLNISGHSKVDITAKSGYRLNLFFYSSNSGSPQDYYTGTTGYQTAHHLDGADLKYVAIVISRPDEAVIDTTLTSSDFFGIEFIESKMDALETELKEELETVKNNLVVRETPYQKTSNSPQTGWLKGYYSGDVGDTITLNSTSNNYIRLHNAITVNNYSMLKHASFIEVAPPSLYAVRIFELDSNDVVTGVWGNMNTQTYPEDAGKAWKIPCDPTKKYRINMGRFNGDAAAKSVDTTLINATKLRFYVPETPYKFKTFDYEFFTVDVERPLTFGDEETSETTETIEAVLRLPASYDPYGVPTRLVLACHGASGYIQASTSTWYNDNWKTFMDALLNAGYAVFDANIFPTSAGTGIMGQAVGSPFYINVLKKAYDYIQSNYNVTKEIFTHGTSMGGVGATAFSHAYPNLVLAESSFAGRDFIRYLWRIYTNASDLTDDYAIAYGYASLDDLATDKYSHAEGLFPCLSLVKCVDGVPVLPPDRDSAYSDWLAYFSQLGNLAQDADAGVWSGKRSVPYKAWNSWADNVAYTKLQTVLQKAYNKGNSCPYYIVNYDSGTHTQMSYGQINDMIPQLIAWFKRWE